MKLTILGGGGFRTPLVYEAVATGASGLIDGFSIDEIALYDIDAARLNAIEAVITTMRAELGDGSGAVGPTLTVTTDLSRAVAGADYIFSAIRVGGALGRTRDERVALAAGALGQETIGAGGLAYALRTIPVMRDIARTIAAKAPGAWVINFTNPAGIVTEAMRGVLGNRVVGICDTPIGLVKRIARLLGVPADELGERVRYDYAGLNHLGWLRGVKVDGEERLPEILASDDSLQAIEEARLIGFDWVRAEKALPNEYLYYYLYGPKAVESVKESGTTRGEFLLEQQERFYADVGSATNPLALWREVLHEREATYMAESRNEGESREEADVAGGGYQEVALRLMAALATGREERMILNVGNQRSALGGIPGMPIIEGLPTDVTVEVPCVVDASGVHPEPVSPLALEQLGLVARQRGAERHILNAATNGSRSEAWMGFAHHPLISSPELAATLLNGYVEAHPEIAELLTNA